MKSQASLRVAFDKLDPLRFSNLNHGVSGQLFGGSRGSESGCHKNGEDWDSRIDKCFFLVIESSRNQTQLRCCVLSKVVKSGSKPKPMTTFVTVLLRVSRRAQRI